MNASEIRERIAKAIDGFEFESEADKIWLLNEFNDVSDYDLMENAKYFSRMTKKDFAKFLKTSKTINDIMFFFRHITMKRIERREILRNYHLVYAKVMESVYWYARENA